MFLRIWETSLHLNMWSAFFMILCDTLSNVISFLTCKPRRWSKVKMLSFMRGLLIHIQCTCCFNTGTHRLRLEELTRTKLKRPRHLNMRRWMFKSIWGGDLVGNTIVIKFTWGYTGVPKKKKDSWRTCVCCDPMRASLEDTLIIQTRSGRLSKLRNKLIE